MLERSGDQGPSKGLQSGSEAAEGGYDGCSNGIDHMCQ